MLNKNVETFIGCDKDFENSDIVLFGAPFDSTTSYRPGTRFASKAMRAESFGLETYSPYQDKDLEDINVFDAGDLELPFGNTERVLDEIASFTNLILNENKKPVMIGGEHLVTLGAFREIFKKYPDVHVLHLDAHTDLREDYLGEKLSHATVIKRVFDLVGDDKIFQFGIRSGERDEFLFAKEHNYINKFNLETFNTIVEKIKDKPIYFTLDLDILDPSCFSGTGTPEAGGVTFIELLNAIIKLSGLNIVGADINELSPIYDQSGSSTALACKILRELLLSIS